MPTSRERCNRANLVPACRCELTQRGPNWLFVHIDTVGLGCGLGERLWGLAHQQFTYRLVLDFDAQRPSDPRLGLELGELSRRLAEQGGALRLCGLSAEVAAEVLAEAGCPKLHNHATDYDAVWGGTRCDGERIGVPG